MKIKKTLLSFLFIYSFVSTFGLLNAQASKPIPPSPPYYVYDETGLLTQGLPQLQQKLQALEKRTTAQIVVAMFQSLDQEDLVEYTNHVFAQWKIGQKQANNGLLLAAYLKERKIRIEVGYGLEPFITDAFSKRVIEEVIKPSFKNGDYILGIDQALSLIQSKITGEKPPQHSEDRHSLSLWVVIIFILFWSMLSRFLDTQVSRTGSYSTWRNSGGRFGGGGFGGGGFGGGGFSGGGGSSGGGGASGGW